jgi:hypothetical protein
VPETLLSIGAQRHDAVLVAEQHVTRTERDVTERHRDIDLAESGFPGCARRRAHGFDAHVET